MAGFAITGGRSPLGAPIDTAATGDNTIVAAQAGKRVVVTGYTIVGDGTVNARWKSGASTNLSGAMALVANSGVSAYGQPWSPVLTTAAGEALVLNLGGAVGVRGHVTYFVESD